MPLFDDPRSSWGAAPSTNQVPLDRTKVTEFITHWEGTALPDLTDHAKCLALVKSIQNYHQNTKGWADIGYTGLVCPHGRRIEGRGWNVGAHTANHNTTGVGWCLLAGPEDPPTDAMFTAQCDARRLTQHELGRILTAHGHRDFAATDCPGDTAYSWVKAGMPYPDVPNEEEAMTKEQADQIISALDTLVAAVQANTDAVTTLANGLGGLSEQVGARVSTVVTQSIVETMDAQLGGIEVAARYVRR